MVGTIEYIDGLSAVNIKAKNDTNMLYVLSCVDMTVLITVDGRPTNPLQSQRLQFVSELIPDILSPLTPLTPFYSLARPIGSISGLKDRRIDSIMRHLVERWVHLGPAWRRLPSSIVSTVQSKRPPRRSWSKTSQMAEIILRRVGGLPSLICPRYAPLLRTAGAPRGLGLD